MVQNNAVVSESICLCCTDSMFVGNEFMYIDPFPTNVWLHYK
jgi:hypothetical protein